MEGGAGRILHDLRQQIIGKTAKQVRNEGRLPLRLLKRLHWQLVGLARDQHRRMRESRGLTAADDPPDRAFTPDRGDFDRAPGRQLDSHRDGGLPDREDAGSDLLPALEDDFPKAEVDQLAIGLDKSARFSLEGREEAIAGECRVGATELIDHGLCHLVSSGVRPPGHSTVHD